MPYVGNLKDIPNGWHLCDGTDGTPNLLDNRFLEGDVTIGTFKEPGLPNLAGSFSQRRGTTGDVFSTPSGAFYDSWLTVDNTSYSPGNNVNYPVQIINFSATHFNPIYGASTTVQPRSYTVLYIIKIK